VISQELRVNSGKMGLLLTGDELSAIPFHKNQGFCRRRRGFIKSLFALILVVIIALYMLFVFEVL